MLKVTKLAEYLQSIETNQDDDLVVVVDGQSINLQLPVENLVDRYYRITEESNTRLEHHLGRAYHHENIRERILFAPGNVEEARWRAPHLDGGVIIGTLSSMRKLFSDSKGRLARNDIDMEAIDSDPYIMSTLMRQQNYMREVARTNHASLLERLFSPMKGWKHRSEDVNMDSIDPTRTYEYGIGLDSMGDVMQQTSNSRNAKWVRYNDFNETIASLNEDRNDSDCQLIIHPELPKVLKRGRLQPTVALDIAGQPSEDPMQPVWDEIPLYTNLCTGTVPVMVQSTGVKEERDQSWKKTWIYPNARNLLSTEMTPGLHAANDVGDWEDFKKSPASKQAGGAWTDSGYWMSWDVICPAELQSSVFPQ